VLLGGAALVAAMKTVRGDAEPYSICGSLPLVDKLQEAGFGAVAARRRRAYVPPHCACPPHGSLWRALADVQITGFGLSSTYHANNEYCLLSDMEKGFRIMAHTIANLL
jgi:acetylornithine deacetylase